MGGGGRDIQVEIDDGLTFEIGAVVGGGPERPLTLVWYSDRAYILLIHI